MSAQPKRHVVLKALDWSPNGFTIETLPVGAERDFGDSAAGLLAEGWIGAEKAAEPEPVVVEPEPVVEPVAAEPEPEPASPEPEPAPTPEPKRRNRN